jgi:hypothetical protein
MTVRTKVSHYVEAKKAVVRIQRSYGQLETRVMMRSLIRRHGFNVLLAQLVVRKEWV